MNKEIGKFTEAERKAEYRKELKALIKKDKNVNGYIETASMLNGINYSSKSVTADQLNELIMFITNEQLAKERSEREQRGGII